MSDKYFKQYGPLPYITNIRSNKYTLEKMCKNFFSHQEQTANPKMRTMVYQAVIISQSSYGCEISTPYCQNITKLEHFQQ